MNTSAKMEKAVKDGSIEIAIRYAQIVQAEAAIRQAEALERIADNWERMWQFKLDQHSHE